MSDVELTADQVPPWASWAYKLPDFDVSTMPGVAPLRNPPPWRDEVRHG